MPAFAISKLVSFAQADADKNTKAANAPAKMRVINTAKGLRVLRK